MYSTNAVWIQLNPTGKDLVEVETRWDFRTQTREESQNRQDSDLASTRSRTNDREELSSDTAAAGVKNEIYLASDRWLPVVPISIFPVNDDIPEIFRKRLQEYLSFTRLDIIMVLLINIFSIHIFIYIIRTSVFRLKSYLIRMELRLREHTLRSTRFFF